MKFSVIIPTFNRAKTIKRAIDSVLNQSYLSNQYVVINSIIRLVIIPPTIGAAILFITSEPVPIPIIIGINPSRVVIENKP